MSSTAVNVAESQYINTHPMDSSKMLSSLLQLTQLGEESTTYNPIDEIINVQILRRLLSAIYFRDVATVKHSRRVALLNVGIGSRLGWEEDQLRFIEIAALLHDIGKIGIPDYILSKPGKLSPDEAEFIAAHHRVGIELLQACHVHYELTNIIAQSHGLCLSANPNQEGTQSLGARILAVADAYEALTSDRPYRPAFSENDALRILHEQSGKGFDRNVVAALDRWLKSDDSSILADDVAAEAAVEANAPRSESAKANAAFICQFFQYLHMLENLYDAFYVIDADRRIAVWNSGAVRLFGNDTADLVGQPWHRSLVSSVIPKPDPVERVFEEYRANCHLTTLKDVEGRDQEFDVQSAPVFDDNGEVIAVAEFVCDIKESKTNRGHFRKLQIAATRDSLTGVVNRGELDYQLSVIYEKWENEPTIPFSVVFLDIDHFKAINDRLTHAIGDRVLTDIARLVQDELYSGEVIGRYGGEEFVILCPETPLETAIERAERLRRIIMNGQYADRDDLRVTASFGIAQVEIGDTTETVMKRADQALYDAKNSGRNRTCHRATRRIHMDPTEGKRSSAKDWVHQSEIVTCVGSSMLPMKLKGFVNDNLAKIVEVKEDRLVIQVGKSGLFSGWGNTADRQPVVVEMDIEELPDAHRASGTRRLLLKTRSTPVGKPSNHDDFESRATIVVENLRSYLIAD